MSQPQAPSSSKRLPLTVFLIGLLLGAGIAAGVFLILLARQEAIQEERHRQELISAKDQWLKAAARPADEEAAYERFNTYIDYLEKDKRAKLYAAFTPEYQKEKSRKDVDEYLLANPEVRNLFKDGRRFGMSKVGDNFADVGVIMYAKTAMHKYPGTPIHCDFLVSMRLVEGRIAFLHFPVTYKKHD
jgi:hypothetical protein